MILSGLDELNAYRNSDGSWTVEGYSDKIKFSLDYASIEMQLHGMIDSPMELEIILRGAVTRKE